MTQSAHSSSLLSLESLKGLGGARIGIVHTEWNDSIVAEQLAGAQRICDSLGVEIVHKLAVPGAVEIPFGCRLLHRHFENAAEEERPEALITFGAVIRGGTPHFEYVCQAVTDGVTQLNLSLPVPVIFGVLTLESLEQAWERLGGAHGHKGEEAAITALKMIQAARTLRDERDRNRKGIGFQR